jgi:hypothetical protein
MTKASDANLQVAFTHKNISSLSPPSTARRKITSLCSNLPFQVINLSYKYSHIHHCTQLSLLANRSVAESSALGVVDLVRHDLLDLFREALLQGLGDLGVAGGV